MANGTPEQRRLAAIMFTDMVGYSALVQRNESLALELLEEHRRLLRDQFPRFQGREVETTGDGFLVEFASALQACRCAAEIQQRMAARNQSASPERQVQVRIGIHVGDVVHRDDGHVLGDGVNIAARLQPLAEPGGICVSNAVYEQVRNHAEFTLVKLGAAALKNIARPMDVYGVLVSGGSAKAPLGIAGASRRGPAVAALAVVILLAIGGGYFWIHNRNKVAPTNKVVTSLPPAQGQSVAVIPFTTMSAQPEKDEYLSEGLTEHLTTVLSQVRGLRVPARTSATVFKEKREDIRQIGQQLNVLNVLEGSVQKVGNRIRITAQLIDARNGYHLWSTNYDRDLVDIFEIQNEVAQRVVAELKVQLLPEQISHLTRRPADDVEAYALYLKGRHLQSDSTEAALMESIGYFRQAIARQTNFALAYAGLADSLRYLTPGFRAPLEVMPEAKKMAEKALELDSTLSETHTALGVIHFYFDWDWPAAEKEFKTALTLNPGNANAHRQYAVYLAVMKQPALALQEIQAAQRLDPFADDLESDYQWVLFLDGKNDSVIARARAALQRNPKFSLFHANLGLALAEKGQVAESLTELESAYEADASFGPALALAIGYAKAGRKDDAQKLLDKMAALSQQRYVCAYEVASAYSVLGQDDQALKWLRKGLAERCDCLVFPQVEPFFKRLFADPRFVDVLKAVGLVE